ncbi:hypothetical protein ACT691_20055 [Vibrio metschnikovii]
MSDGLQAIERVKEQDYDLIFMDNQLPYLGALIPHESFGMR